MNRKRGQAAMEFLMTYGWALLAIVIIGGLLWVYIGGKECGKSVSGALGQNVAITDHKVLANGGVTAGTAGNCYKEEDVAVVYSVTGGTSHTLNLKTSGTYE